MLNPFPLQYLSLLAYAILRVITGCVLCYLASQHVRERETLKNILGQTFSFFPYGLVSTLLIALAELIVGLMFIAGFYTQIAALLGMALSLKCILFRKRLPAPHFPGTPFYVLLFGISLSLFITGAGVFAFDLPI